MQHQVPTIALVFSACVLLCLKEFPATVEGGIAPTADFQFSGYCFSLSVDPITRALFCSASTTNRILRYPALEQINGSSLPISVIGQPNLTATAPYPVPSALSITYPRAIWVDSQGTLWAVEYTNHRVLWYKNAGSLMNQPSADGVVGQVNFSANAANVGPNGLLNPQGLCVVSNTLWIADSEHHRVLRFDNADSLPQFNAAANAVIGQPDFTGTTTSPNPQGMGGPCGVRFIINIGLLVGDCLYDRVVYYPVAETQKPSGAIAAYEYGKTNFSFPAADPPIEYQLLNPSGITTSSDGQLFIASPYLNRVLLFPPLPPTADRTKPVAVFGQPDLVTNTSGLTLDTLSSPHGPYYDDATNTLWVCGGTFVSKYSNALPKAANNTVPTVDLGFESRSPDFNLAAPASSTDNSITRPAVSTGFDTLTETPAGIIAPFQPDGYVITTNTDPNGNLQFNFTTNQPADLKIDYTLFATETPLSSAGVDFLALPGSLKMAIAISNWNFTSNTSLLELNLSIVVTPPVTSMTTTNTTGYTTYTLYSSTVSTTTIRLLKYCVIDNTTNTPLNFTFSQTSTTSNSTFYSLIIQFPFFSQSVFYDPDFSVVVTTNDGGDGDDLSWLPYLSLIAVVLIPLVVLLVVVIAIVLCVVKRHRQKLFENRKLHQINF